MARLSRRSFVTATVRNAADLLRISTITGAVLLALATTYRSITPPTKPTDVPPPAGSHARAFTAQEITVPGYYHVWVQGLNARGEVVGGAWNETNRQRTPLRPFLWQSGKVTWLPLAPGMEGAVPFAVNESGTVVGTIFGGKDTVCAAVWKDGDVTILERRTWKGTARAINDAGIVAGHFMDDYGEFRAFRWQGGDSLSPLGYWTVDGMNTAGTVAGTEFSDYYGLRALVYEAGTMRILPIPSGYIMNSAAAINNYGQVAGKVIASDNSVRATIWNPDGTVTILRNVNSEPFGINDDGLVVGTEWQPVKSNETEPFLWKPDGQATALRPFLPGDAAPAAWKYLEANAINNAGQILVDGVDQTKPERHRGFLLTPRPLTPRP